MDDTKSLPSETPEEENAFAIAPQHSANLRPESSERTPDEFFTKIRTNPRRERKERAAIRKAVLDRVVSAVEEAERMGIEAEPVQQHTPEELSRKIANFSDEDWVNFMRITNPGFSPESGDGILPTLEQYAEATGRELNPMQVKAALKNWRTFR